MERKSVPSTDLLGGGDEATNMMSPDVMATLQKHLQDIEITPSMSEQAVESISLHTMMKRRIRALKKLQVGMNKIESRFFQEVHHLECKYAAVCEPLYRKRYDIITAGADPTDDDCEWESDDEDDRLADELVTKIDTATADTNSLKGIPEFWLTVIKNVDIINKLIQDHDEPVLRYLTDIKLHLNKNTGFTLEFVFAANDYFSNSSLRKEYFYRFSVDDTNPIWFEGPEIVKCTGCPIDWRKGKNITVKLIKKVQKHRGRGIKRTVTKAVQTDSFFNFFSPPYVPGGEDPDEETEALLTTDFEIGHYLREHVIPRAILYYTGEAAEGDDDEYDDEDDMDDQVDVVYDHDQDEERDPEYPVSLNEYDEEGIFEDAEYDA